jgi:NTE family protein
MTVGPWLGLSGGNALGSYHAGVYEALHEHRVEPSRLAGASIGAVTGALIAGKALDQRMARLREFWQLVRDDGPSMFVPSGRSRSTLQALLTGRPALYRPSFPGL